MKILLVQTSFLGDTILSTPVIGTLKHIYPAAEIWLMTTPAAATLLGRDPRLRGIITFAKRGREKGLRGLWRKSRELKALGFDQVFSLHRSARTSLLLALSGIPRRIGFKNARMNWLYSETRKRPQELHDVQRNLALLAGLPDSKKPGLELDERLFLAPPPASELPMEIRDFMAAAGDYAVVFPGSAWETKRWSATGYHQVAAWLLKKGLQVVLLGSEEEKAVCRQVAGDLPLRNLAGKIGLDAALGLTAGARLMVCNDSMALHMASALKIPTVAIFCATVPAFGFGPWQNQAIIVEKQGLACRPCARHGSRRCPNRSRACMDQLPAAAVIKAVSNLLAVSSTETNRAGKVAAD